ncbi:tyrosine-type recombinase/integrase [Pseudochrobactrum sp. sp1633]|uniref:tyrosine-type recombinase/integrase n=1 Tax=Pseudochrobactrum sp. sp1633 TaxID=3036706 RepID=UPI0025A5712C|nr:site-specific integrase [Pseudochrobactrum sp. sp1633]MDM8347262.1 tyrosine-type recombinase/integrase [Pseudochrobactrum sp. sp1633]
MISDAKARKLSPTDKPLSDGGVKGLYLFSGSIVGAGKWIFRFTSPETRKRRDMGLGRYPEVSVKLAREQAWATRQMVETGMDPLEERARQKEQRRVLQEMPTFEHAARTVHAGAASGFRNQKHIDQWINTLVEYVFPKIGKRKVDEITVADFASCLKPIWLEKPETASRVKQRCDKVMKWCVANGYIMASPVGVVDQLLPKQPGNRQRVEHHPAVPWHLLPEVYSAEIASGHISDTKLMLEILILTACRSGEVRMMEWNEVDFNKAIWTIPASRMKANSAHRVPLTSRVFEILQYKQQIKIDNNPLVFHSRKGTPYSDMTMTKFLRDQRVESDTAGRIATAHGFRSSFRDWASENGYPRDVAERALAHVIKSSTEAAYHRTDLLDKRRLMMQTWQNFIMNI